MEKKGKILRFKEKIWILLEKGGEKVGMDLRVEDLIELTLQRFRAKRFRAFLTILGMGVGVGAVYFLVSLTFGLQQLVIGKIATDESLLTIDVFPNTEVKELVILDQKAVEEIKNLPGVKEVSPVKSLPAEISLGDLKGQTVVYGVDSSFFRLGGVIAEKGEVFQKGEKEKIVISSAILSLFGLREEEKALGTKVRLSLILSSSEGGKEASESGELVHSIELPSQFIIKGIVTDSSNYLYLPSENLSFLEKKEYQLVKVKVSSQKEIDPVREKIVAMGFLTTAMSDTLDQVNRIFRFTQITFTVVGVVALVIAAIGMLNTMTVSLLERTREIGIMKAIGATPRGVKQLFLAESVVMGLGGGVAGLIMGFVFSRLVALLVALLAVSLGGKPVDIFYTPSWFVGLVFLFSFVIGLVTGFYPARRAAKIDPLDALRYE